jgi:hypothetical protein
MRTSDFRPGNADERVGDADAHWTPDGALIFLVGIVNHLTHVEWRWINGGMLGEPVSRSESEFAPGPDVTLDAPCGRNAGTDLRWVLLRLINETARHAGHADATRELLDGTTGE